MKPVLSATILLYRKKLSDTTIQEYMSGILASTIPLDPRLIHPQFH